MDREAPHFISQNWLGSLLVIAQQGYLSLRSFAQLRPVSRSFAEPSWCRNQAFLSARFAWTATERQRRQLANSQLSARFAWTTTERRRRQLANSQ